VSNNGLFGKRFSNQTIISFIGNWEKRPEGVVLPAAVPQVQVSLPKGCCQKLKLLGINLRDDARILFPIMSDNQVITTVYILYNDPLHNTSIYYEKL